MNKKPIPSDFGYSKVFGWPTPDEEQQFIIALDNWCTENRCPECFNDVGKDELEMFGGYCESCHEKSIIF